MEFEERVVVYYCIVFVFVCFDGGIIGNNVDFNEVEQLLQDFNEDVVFYGVFLILDEGVMVMVKIGENEQMGIFMVFFVSGVGIVGIYRGSVLFGGNSGDVVVIVFWDGQVVVIVEGGKLLGVMCEFEIQNWNVVVVQGVVIF